MSEKLTNHSEKHEQSQKNHDKDHQEKLKKTIEKGQSAKHEHAERLDEIRSQVESEAKHKNEHMPDDSKESEQDRPTLVNRELKEHAYRRTLRKTQDKLPAPARAFSKIIHQPAVEVASEVAAKTIARPSGILTGGIIACLGSSIFLWAAKHYGYEYNFLLFAIFFAGGFILGLLIEFTAYLFAKRK